MQVNNTDAEGRLTLADALLYCQQQGVTEEGPAGFILCMNAQEERERERGKAGHIERKS